MKRIYLKDYGVDEETKQPLTTLVLMRMALKFGPSQSGGVDFEELERRSRVFAAMDALEPGAVYLDVEDADFEKIKTIMRGHKWGIAVPELTNIIRALIDSREPPVIAMPAPVREAAE